MELTHVDAAGNATMVDVGAKSVTARTAVAAGRLIVSPAVIEVLRRGGVPKGDALGVAKIAGIMAAKRTSELIPLCHQVALESVEVSLTLGDGAIEVEATARCSDRTGVEMEALTAVAVAGLTLHDMVKALDPAAVMTDIRLVRKTGGKSGVWERP